MMAIHGEGHKGGVEYGIDAHLAIAQGNNEFGSLVGIATICKSKPYVFGEILEKTAFPFNFFLHFSFLFQI
jgi:hypothetical protein